MKYSTLLMVAAMTGVFSLTCIADPHSVAINNANTAANNTQLPPQRVLWNKQPIPLHIQRGQERIVHFPDDIRYWLPESIKHKVTVLAANGVLYIQAHDSFTATRIRVQGLTSRQIYLLDVSADDAEPENVARHSNSLIVMEADTVSNQAKHRSTTTAPTDWKIRLTRFAAQQLYAPERLLVGDRLIERMAVKTQPMALIRGGQLLAVPIAAWKGGGLFVTAIKLTNQTTQSLSFTLQEASTANHINLSRQLRGHWLTATVQHQNLKSTGDDADTTTLYLVSERPFSESLEAIHHG